MQASLKDRAGIIIATLNEVTFDSDTTHYSGQIHFITKQAELRSLLLELETLANDNCLSLIDPVWDKINDFDLAVDFEDGQTHRIKDLFLNSEDNSVVFKLA